MTTNAVPESRDGRSVDFHELYWAHLMSETKAVAVLLWLYELGRKGPIMKLGINGLWWAACDFSVPDEPFLCRCWHCRCILLFCANKCAQDHAGCAVSADFARSLVLGFAIASEMARVPSHQSVPASFCTGSACSIIRDRLLRRRIGSRAGSPNVRDGRWNCSMVAAADAHCLDRDLSAHGRHGLRAFWRALWISLVMCGIFIAADRFWHPDNSRMSKHCSTAWPWALNSPWSAGYSRWP